MIPVDGRPNPRSSTKLRRPAAMSRLARPSTHTLKIVGARGKCRGRKMSRQVASPNARVGWSVGMNGWIPVGVASEVHGFLFHVVFRRMASAHDPRGVSSPVHQVAAGCIRCIKTKGQAGSPVCLCEVKAFSSGMAASIAVVCRRRRKSSLYNRYGPTFGHASCQRCGAWLFCLLVHVFVFACPLS